MRSLSVALALLFVGPVQAALFNISVDQDVSLSNSYADTNLNSSSNQWLWVGDNTGDRDVQSMFGFDMTSLTSQLGSGQYLVINSIGFSAYNNYNDGNGFVDIALGNTDNWDDDVVTWNSSADDHGAALDSVYLSGVDLNSYVSWDVSGINVADFINDSYLSFYLSIPAPGDGDNWHDFEPLESSQLHEAYLTVDYSITNVPIPAAVWLFGSALAGLGWLRRKPTV
jgi:hypothetical protein